MYYPAPTRGRSLSLLHLFDPRQVGWLFIYTYTPVCCGALDDYADLPLANCRAPGHVWRARPLFRGGWIGQGGGERLTCLCVRVWGRDR